MYGLNLSGLVPVPKPRSDNNEPVRRKKNYRCVDCDVRWDGFEEDSACWSCGNGEPESPTPAEAFAVPMEER